ncbi:hypothetical protein ACJX0J_014489, partial [Zea mays]
QSYSDLDNNWCYFTQQKRNGFVYGVIEKKSVGGINLKRWLAHLKLLGDLWNGEDERSARGILNEHLNDHTILVFCCLQVNFFFFTLVGLINKQYITSIFLEKNYIYKYRDWLKLANNL